MTKRFLSEQFIVVCYLTGLKRYRHPNGTRYRRPFWRLRSTSDETDRIIRDIRPEFDPHFYLAHNADVRAARLDPVIHYVLEGWKESRDPNSFFSTADYLTAHPDVRSAGVNPFWHYIVAGRSEGRTVTGKYSNADRLKRVSTIAAQEAHASIMDRLDASLSVDQIKSALSGVQVANSLFIAVSHDNYKHVAGGIQLCLQIEEKAAQNAGGMYLQIFPFNSRTWLSRSDDDALILGINFNGAFIGTSSAADFFAALRTYALPKARLVIHSLLGHSPSFLIKLNDLCDEDPVYWNHDHSSICVSYNLLRNTITCCDGPSVNSVQCKICVFGEERADHLRRVQGVFNALNPIVVSPSTFAREFWEQRTEYKHSQSVVVEHCRLGPPEHASTKSGTARIAFIGTAAYHKGWDVFLELATKFSRDDRYEFHAFGRHTPINSIHMHDVNVSEEGPAAMRDALAKNAIDIAVLWSQWPETFCFTAFEAISAGCFILTSGQSGNIASLVESTGRGELLRDKLELFNAFESGETLRLVDRRRREAKQMPLVYSRMTADVV